MQAWVWISGCPQQSQNLTASDYGLFDASVIAEPDCAVGNGVATASQTSAILPERLEAVGAGHFSVASPQVTVIHSLARSRYDVTFELSQARQFSLDGSIAAARTGTNSNAGSVAFTTVTLSGPSGALHSFTVQPPLNQPQSLPIHVTGELQPGVYRVVAHAQAFVDQSFNNSFVEADVSFDIVLDLEPIPITGDVTGDGIVNVADLLAVLEAWGACTQPCPPSCPADVTGDCIVNVQDLLAVIQAWS